MMFTYTGDGRREPFDPATLSGHLAGCCLCGNGCVATIGIFVPATDAMRAVVLRLRWHATRPQSTPCIAYGLCTDCIEQEGVCDRVEQALEAAAARVVLQ